MLDDIVELGRQLKDVVCEQGLTVAVAESLTSGALASAMGRAPSSSDWFLGGVVSYATRVKVEVLGATDGPTVTRLMAEEMARGVGALMRADLALSTTGVGGPGPKEDQPEGTVWIGVWSARGVRAERFHFPGDPSQIVERATAQAVAMGVDEAHALARMSAAS